MDEDKQYASTSVNAKCYIDAAPKPEYEGTRTASSTGSYTFNFGSKTMTEKELYEMGYRLMSGTSTDVVYKRYTATIIVKDNLAKTTTYTGYVIYQEDNVHPEQTKDYIYYSNPSQLFKVLGYTPKYDQLTVKSYTYDHVLLDNVKSGIAPFTSYQYSWDNKSKTATFTYAPNIIYWLKNIEIGPIADKANPYYILDNGEPIGIKIQNAEDGYVTIGYGHAIQSQADADRYGFPDGNPQPDTTIRNYISNQKSKYGTGLSNPAILSFSRAQILLETDFRDSLTEAKRLAGATNKTFMQNQIDALASVLFNGNKPGDSDSLSYWFSRQSKTDSIRVLRKSYNGGNNDGALRRRLMEFNIFFNGDYTFYDDTELSKLKTLTGF